MSRWTGDSPRPMGYSSKVTELSHPRRARIVAILLTALLLPATPGCRGDRGRGMVRLPPPPNWSAELERFREAKDEHFRSAPDSPLKEEWVAGFEGLEYWEPDESYYFAGDLRFYAEPVELQMPDTANELRPALRAGWLEFEIDGETQRLQVYRMLDDPQRRGGQGYFLPFADATTGKETYETGRYVELIGPEGGPFVLDFNRAYNPFCAYGKPYACPLTPKENRLDVRIEAGEREFAPS